MSTLMSAMMALNQPIKKSTPQQSVDNTDYTMEYLLIGGGVILVLVIVMKK